VLLIGVQNGLGVAAGGVTVAGLLQPGTDIGMVEDLAVVNEPKRTVFVCHRLVAAGNVYDAEPAMPQKRMPVVVQSVIVGPTMLDLLRHASQRSQCLGVGLLGDESGDAAHANSLAAHTRAPLCALRLRAAAAFAF
jgi:hypothetical protein